MLWEFHYPRENICHTIIIFRSYLNLTFLKPKLLALHRLEVRKSRLLWAVDAQVLNFQHLKVLFYVLGQTEISKIDGTVVGYPEEMNSMIDAKCTIYIPQSSSFVNNCSFLGEDFNILNACFS